MEKRIVIVAVMALAFASQAKAQSAAVLTRY